MNLLEMMPPSETDTNLASATLKSNLKSQAIIGNTSIKKSFKETDQNFVSPAAFIMSDQDDLRLTHKEPKSILKNSSMKKTIKKDMGGNQSPEFGNLGKVEEEQDDS